jgi:hypothetical protein
MPQTKQMRNRNGNKRSQPILEANRRFGKYKKEEQSAVRQKEKAGMSVIGRLLRAYERFEFLHDQWFENDRDREKLLEFTLAKGLIENIEYTSDDIELLSHIMAQKDLGEIESGYGFFLNVLIQCSQETDFRIVTSGIGERVSQLGTNNTKNIIVNGGLGEYAFARGMTGGIIDVHGFADIVPGDCLVRGTIIIRGSANIIDFYDRIEFPLDGGTIIFKGEVFYDAEKISSKDLAAIINDHSQFKRGTIIRRGKMIWEA